MHNSDPNTTWWLWKRPKPFKCVRLQRRILKQAHAHARTHNAQYQCINGTTFKPFSIKSGPTIKFKGRRILFPVGIFVCQSGVCCIFIVVGFVGCAYLRVVFCVLCVCVCMSTKRRWRTFGCETKCYPFNHCSNIRKRVLPRSIRICHSSINGFTKTQWLFYFPSLFILLLHILIHQVQIINNATNHYAQSEQWMNTCLQKKKIKQTKYMKQYLFALSLAFYQN